MVSGKFKHLLPIIFTEIHYHPPKQPVLLFQSKIRKLKIHFSLDTVKLVF